MLYGVYSTQPSILNRTLLMVGSQDSNEEHFRMDISAPAIENLNYDPYIK